METEIKGIMRVDVSVKPAEISGDRNWYATLSGITGDALALPRGDIDFYARPPTKPSGGRGPNANPRNPGGNPSPQNPNPNPDNGKPNTDTPDPTPDATPSE
jgi:hypothetical protein